MSAYTVGEILIYLMMTTALGGAIGWAVRGLRRPDPRPDPGLDTRVAEQGRAIAQLHDLLADRREIESRIHAVQSHAQSRTSELDRLKLVVAERAAQLDVVKARLRTTEDARSDEETLRLRAEEAIEACRARSATLIRERDRSLDRVAFLEERIAQGDARVAELRAEIGTLKDRASADEDALNVSRGTLTARDRTISELQLQLREVTQERDAVEAEATSLLNQLRTARAERQSDPPDARLQAELSRREDQVRDLREALLEAQSQAQSVDVLDEAAQVREARMRDLEAALLEAKRSHLVELEQARQDAESAARRIAQQDDRIRDLEACVDGLARDTDIAIGRLTDERDAQRAERERLEQALHARDELIESMQSRLARISRPPTQSLPPVGVEVFELADPVTEAARNEIVNLARRTASGEDLPSDDLQRIRGIGPKIEAMLKEMGICSYRQVARLGDPDIDTLGTALGTFPDRIRRDDWMSSARTLHIELYGSDPVA